MRLRRRSRPRILRSKTGHPVVYPNANSEAMRPVPVFLVRILTIGALSASAVCCPARPVHAAAGRVDAALQAVQHAPDARHFGRDSAALRQLRSRGALGTLLTALKGYAPPRTWTGTRSIQGWTVTFSGDASGWKSIPPSWCDSIAAVDPGKSLARLEKRVSTGGEGLPVIMVQKSAAGKNDPHIPRHGRRLPATLTAEFDGGRKVTLTFHNTRNVASSRARGADCPLASDLSAPIAEAMSRRHLSRFALAGLVRPDNHLKDAGIYTPELYDPRKIPLVLIHGLESAPHIWANIMNEVTADPVLRQRYQVWYYLYPSGLTLQAAACRFRESLNGARDFYDPAHRSAAMRQMVLAGHSMGGLLARMQVIDSGEYLYRAFWTRPLKELPLSAGTRDLVCQTLYFKHQPFISRVIFLSTPHRGSRMAELSIVRLVSRLIVPSKLIAGLFHEMQSVARYAVNPDLQRFRDLGSRATEGLSPQHPLLHALERRPMLVPYHNIIAVFPPTSFARPVEKSNDGVVPWSSSFLPGAVSTAVVSGFHTSAENPASAKEIVRILRDDARR